LLLILVVLSLTVEDMKRQSAMTAEMQPIQHIRHHQKKNTIAETAFF
jgi:hypothetical protein